MSPVADVEEQIKSLQVQLKNAYRLDRSQAPRIEAELAHARDVELPAAVTREKELADRQRAKADAAAHRKTPEFIKELTQQLHDSNRPVEAAQTKNRADTERESDLRQQVAAEQAEIATLKATGGKDALQAIAIKKGMAAVLVEQLEAAKADGAASKADLDAALKKRDAIAKLLAETTAEQAEALFFDKGLKKTVDQLEKEVQKIESHLTAARGLRGLRGPAICGLRGARLLRHLAGVLEGRR